MIVLGQYEWDLTFQTTLSHGKFGPKSLAPRLAGEGSSNQLGYRGSMMGPPHLAVSFLAYFLGSP